MDNFQATKLIKNLYSKKNIGKYTKFEKQKIVENGLEIFGKIVEPKNSFSINTVLTLCLRLECTQKIDLIWDDIQILSKNNKAISECYTLLIMSCIESINIDKCIQVLSWMEQYHHKLTLHLGHIAKLLNECNPSLFQLKYIESLMDKDIMDKNEYIQCALVKGYGQLKDIPSALNIFNSIDGKKHNNIVINTMLTSMINNGYNKEAIELYHKINANHANIDNITHYLAIKACINIQDYKTGHNIHTTLKLYGNRDEIKIKTQLIDFYGIFGHVTTALSIFDSILDNEKDIVSVGAMLKVFVNNGFYQEVIKLYDKIDEFPNVTKDAGCHVLAIKACANIKDITKGQAIYDNIPENQRNINIITSVIDFYGQCSDIKNAENVFNSMPQNKQNIVCINSMLTTFVNNGYYDEALKLYDIIDVTKTDTSHVLAITACSKGNKYIKGQNIYKHIKNTNNILIKTSFIDLFGNFKDIKSALDIFNSINNEQMNIITINAMMTALINNECNKEALNIYDSIKWYDINKDATTYTMAIKACGNLQNVTNGESIYQQIPLNIKNVQIQTALIQCYGQCNDVDNALKVFNSIADKNKNIVTINSMLTAYINNGYDKEALQLYDEMEILYQHISKDNVLYSVAIKACTNSNNFEKGQRIHNEIKFRKTMKSMDKTSDDTQLHLINMYSKCGMVDLCDEIFEELKETQNKKYSIDINIWNEMINAHLRNNGDISKVKRILNIMREETELKPNCKTYSLLLNGCSHSGEIEQAINIWNNEMNDDIKYDSYIIGTLVDGCSRKGYLYEGYEWIYKYDKIHKKTNKETDYAMWMSLLHGCRQQNNLLLAQYIYYKIVKRYKNDKTRIHSASVLLSNMYGS